MAFIYTGENVQEKPVFKIPPVGEYTVQIIRGEEQLTKTGKKMMKLTCEIIQSEFKNKIFENIVETDYAQQHIYNIFAACGKTPQKGQVITGETFVGWVGKVKIKHEQYNGETQLRIEKWKRPAEKANNSENLIDVPPDDKTLDQIPF
jgi:hypothetical protein